MLTVPIVAMTGPAAVPETAIKLVDSVGCWIETVYKVGIR